jgi:hypothetical protein
METVDITVPEEVAALHQRLAQNPERGCPDGRRRRREASWPCPARSEPRALRSPRIGITGSPILRQVPRDAGRAGQPVESSLARHVCGGQALR